MTRKQLQALISAGVFSAALMAGNVYADDMTAGNQAAPKPVKMKKHKKHTVKAMAKHACAGQNGCKGQGGCKTGDGGCMAKNSCKGKGGCATDGSKKS